MATLVDILSVGAIDSTGEALDSGVAYIYQIDTNSYATIYNDADETDPASNPVTLDSAGRAEVYVTGAVRIVLEDSSGNTIDDIANYGGGGQTRLVSSTTDTVTNNVIPVYSGTNGTVIKPSSITETQLGYLSNVTSDIQTQIGTNITNKATTVFTASGTWTKATLNPKFVTVTVVGGGGGSSGAPDTTSLSTAAAGGGGGGGGTAVKTILAASLGTTETVTVGAGGSSATAGNNSTGGGTSSFGSHCSATGGGGTTASGITGGTGGSGSSGDVNLTGGTGGSGSSSDDDAYFTPLCWGGSSSHAPAIPPFPSSSLGRTGVDYGGGAAGAVTRNNAALNGRDGADGIVIVEEYY
ncbi:MAG: hypothetical protein KDD13_00295 [Mangrovimonas sp.]|nr:hypothetical protein [Mangrovimonas sp.]